MPSAKQRVVTSRRRFRRRQKTVNTVQVSKNSHLDLHRQVDAQGFVLAETAAVSARSATPPIGKHFTTNAYQNPSQSRIRWLNRPERDAIENYCCRVFVDSTWKDDHRSTQRHVPLGNAEPQESER